MALWFSLQKKISACTRICGTYFEDHLFVLSSSPLSLCHILSQVVVVTGRQFLSRKWVKKVHLSVITEKLRFLTTISTNGSMSQSIYEFMNLSVNASIYMQHNQKDWDKFYVHLNSLECFAVADVQLCIWHDLFSLPKSWRITRMNWREWQMYDGVRGPLKMENKCGISSWDITRIMVL